MSTCSFCKQSGHNIKTCRSDLAVPIFDRINRAMAHEDTFKMLYYVLNSMPLQNLKLLCAINDLLTSVTKTIAVNTLMNAYYPDQMGFGYTDPHNISPTILPELKRYCEDIKIRQAEAKRARRAIQQREQRRLQSSSEVREQNRLASIQYLASRTQNMIQTQTQFTQQQRNIDFHFVVNTTPRPELIAFLDFLKNSNIQGEEYGKLLLEFLNKPNNEQPYIDNEISLLLRTDTEVLHNRRILVSHAKLQPLQECAVCLDQDIQPTNVIQLACKHAFCSDCVLKTCRSIGVNNTCPLCRVPIKHLRVESNSISKNNILQIILAQDTQIYSSPAPYAIPRLYPLPNFPVAAAASASL